MSTAEAEKIKEKIYGFLPGNFRNIPVICVDEAGSTNDEIKKLSESFDRLVYIARSQTKGRGRMGRSFFSPKGTRIYMSNLLHPQLEAEMCTLLTPLCAVAVSEAAEAVLGIKTGIKWVNDIYLGHRKVAGILTEGAFSQGKINYAVVGIGINLAPPESDFPQEIKDIASALTVSTEKKEELTAEIIKRFFFYSDLLPKKDFIDSYRKKLLFTGEEITVFSPSGDYTATLEGVDNMCRLIIKTSDGKEETLNAGEISIRKLIK